MTEVDPIFAALTAPGQPFALAERDGQRLFVNMPPDLNMLIESARRHGDKTFIVEGKTRLSFNDVFRLRDALVPHLGITARGDRVAICMRNRAEWAIAFLAAIRAGGVPALVNSRGAPSELAAAVEDVTPVVVLADPERATLLREGGYTGRIIETTDFPESGEAGPPPSPAVPEDPAAILFTSGTTGRVKGAILTHKSLMTGVMGMQLSGMMVLHGMAQKMGIAPETIIANMPQGAVLVVFPLFHISGLGAAFLSPMLAGTKIVIMRRWDPQEALRLIADERITQFTGVPTMLWDVLHGAKIDEADLTSLRNISSGGQALPVNLLDEIRAACPQAMMGTGYGMTETSGMVAMASGEDFIRNRASAGRVLPLAEIRIEGPNGEDQPRGQAGEIVVRGPLVMKGYWNRPEDTAAVLSADGWLRTGDVGYIDDEGYIFIVDRKKDMVISGGENIYCAEVERVLGELPEIIECSTFGIPDERLGELLVAVVVAKDITEAQIIDHVAEHLARYKAPARVAFSPTPLPRNAVGKIDKIYLRANWPHIIGDA
ncbi:MAG: class I adenylate-forming enzyme family protein [Chakrabartia sp.]